MWRFIIYITIIPPLLLTFSVFSCIYFSHFLIYLTPYSNILIIYMCSYMYHSLIPFSLLPHYVCMYQTQTSRQGQLRVGETLYSIWKKENWRGLFAGNGANCLRVLPFSALVCLAYYNMAKVPTQYIQGTSHTEIARGLPSGINSYHHCTCVIVHNYYRTF